MDILKGYKTYIAVIAFVAMGFYQLVNGDTAAALASFTTALGFFGFGKKIERQGS